MSLDIYASLHQKEINKNTLYFMLDENKHRQIFEEARPLSKFKSLNKIRDYYADNTILFGEIRGLLEELNILGFDNDDEFYKFLKKSYDRKLNLYLFCD